MKKVDIEKKILSKIEENINEFYQSMSSDTLLILEFEDVLIHFLKFHYNFLNEAEESFFCSIHKNFTEGHNCVACNLNESNNRIIEFLYAFRTFRDVNTTFSIFILLLYLQVESITEYLNLLALPQNSLKSNFFTLTKIRRWANFLKHPKSFMLVHHAIYSYEQRKENAKKKNAKELNIDTDFVMKYYAGSKENKELFNVLNLKEDVEVIFPNPVELIDEFMKCQQFFKDLISNNEIVRIILDDSATIKNYYENMQDDCSTD